MKVAISEILKYLDGEDIKYEFHGDSSEYISGFSSLIKYKFNSMTWVKNRENIPEGFSMTIVQLAIVEKGFDLNARNSIVCDQSKKAFFGIIDNFFAVEEMYSPVGKFTYISPKVTLGNNVRIGHNCTLDGEIAVGENTVIGNNVVIVNKVIIGSNCEIQSGTIIGHDGFGAIEDENHKKTMIKHYGGVIIGNNVHIGMNNVIARGVIDDTEIREGVKIADLSHIGHNNLIEEDCIIINSAIFGSCHIGRNAYLSYSVIKNQTSIGENAIIGMDSNVIRNVPSDVTVIGNPARILKNNKPSEVTK